MQQSIQYPTMELFALQAWAPCHTVLHGLQTSSLLLQNLHHQSLQCCILHPALPHANPHMACLAHCSPNLWRPCIITVPTHLPKQARVLLSLFTSTVHSTLHFRARNPMCANLLLLASLLFASTPRLIAQRQLTGSGPVAHSSQPTGKPFNATSLRRWTCNDTPLTRLQGNC